MDDAVQGDELDDDDAAHGDLLVSLSCHDEREARAGTAIYGSGSTGVRYSRATTGSSVRDRGARPREGDGDLGAAEAVRHRDVGGHEHLARPEVDGLHARHGADPGLASRGARGAAAT